MESFDVESFLAIIGIFFLPIIMIILIVWFRSNENRKRNQLQAELCAKAIEKGVPIPTDLLVQPKKKHNPLNTGIICIAVGIGISLFLWLAADAEDKLRGASLGIIPFLIGVAYLVIHFIGKKQDVNENAQ